MNTTDLVGLISTVLILLTVGTAIAERVWVERPDRRRQARRVR